MSFESADSQTTLSTASQVKEAIDELDVDGIDDISDVDDAVLSDVDEVLGELTNLDIDINTAEDLERVRQRLPTDPRRANLLHAMLPEPLQESLEYVEGSPRQDPYWRRSREREDPNALSPAELRQRIAFIQAQMENEGVEGTTTAPGGKEIPKTAVKTREELAGAEFTDEGELTKTEKSRGQKLLQRIKDNLPL